MGAMSRPYAELPTELPAMRFPTDYRYLRPSGCQPGRHHATCFLKVIDGGVANPKSLIPPTEKRR